MTEELGDVVAGEKAGNIWAKTLALHEHDIEVVENGESAATGQPLVAAKMPTPNGHAVVSCLHRTDGTGRLTISLGGETISKLYGHENHRSNTLNKLQSVPSYWDELKSKHSDGGQD